MSTETAVREVVRRYLAAYGPATREGFGRRFGTATPAEAGRLLAMLGDETAPVDVEGSTAWMLAAPVERVAASEPSGTVRLLPAFDHYVVAAPRDRGGVVPPSRKGQVYRPQGWLSPMMVVDGRVTATWSHERKRGRVEVRIHPFGKTKQRERERAAAEAERLVHLPRRRAGPELGATRLSGRS